MTLQSTSTLAGLLHKSPFKPIQKHMRTVAQCVSLLEPLFAALYAKDYAEVKKIAGQIDELETIADKMKSTFRLNMPKTLFLPVDRRDMLKLLHDQDTLADKAEEIGQILISRDMEVPEEIQELLNSLLRNTLDICTEAKLIVEQLDELVEVGFGGRENNKVFKMIEQLRKSEHEIDQILHTIRRTLFDLEESLPPVSTMFWYKIISLLGNMSDIAENISDRLLLFLSK
ncbi:MAG: TIGR00153 family protein [Candidatus Electrothrix sp. AS4_5]|nr:TIGR00153 family protein [Candidatus Electrothrix sp. AX1]MCI5189562.1 TIGR00153 family protein [Candidatus Electrothrix gigas]